MNYKEYLNLNQVSVITGKHIYRTELNSHVYSAPALKIEDFIESGDVKGFGVNYIVVTDELNEPLHYHKTNIIALVSYGEGRILYSAGNEDRSDDIKVGDIVIIPSGALHAFESDMGKTATYAVLEFGNKIDYQRHYYPTE